MSLQRVRTAIDGLHGVADTSQHVHVACMQAFEDAGFEVFPECSIRLPDGSYGRIDIVLVDPRNGRHVAIEVDARKPRRGSLAKLHAYEAEHESFSICICRGVTPTQFPGLDLVLSVNVRQATPEEISDKTIVGRWIAERRA